MSVEFELTLDNDKEVIEALREFPSMLKEELFRSYQRSASKEERILKATTGFKDRTGKLRRSLMVVATYNPLAIIMGAMAEYAIYVAEGHGSWRGNWWKTFLDEAIPNIIEDSRKALKKIVDKFNRLMGRVE